jgi:hypothetical protein
MRGYKKRVDEHDDPALAKMTNPEGAPLEGDLTGGGLLPPGILDVDVAEIDPDAGTPPSLDIAGVDDRSTGWAGAEPTLPPD